MSVLLPFLFTLIVVISGIWITTIEIVSVKRDESQPEIQWRWRFLGAAVILVLLFVVRVLTHGRYDASLTDPAFVLVYSMLGAIFVDRVLWITRYRHMKSESS